MAIINYKLNFCRITLASKLFVRNNYFPLFKVLTPQDATREIIKNTFIPKNHYMPVLLSHKKRDRLSGGKRIKELKTYGRRLHSKIDDFKYMSVVLNFDDDKHKKLQEILKNKKAVRGNYVYQIEERNTCLVFDGQIEEAARNGDITDVTISDNADKMIMRLKTGEKVTAEAQSFLLEELLFWGEAATTKDTESRHHYGKMIMSIAHIFEMKERRAALYELEKMKFEAKKKQRIEREWKSGMDPLLENLIRENEANKENEQSNNDLQDIEQKEFKMNIADMSKTSNISDKLMNEGQDAIQKLPVMKEINRMVKRLGEGRFTEMIDTPGVVLKVGDEERFLIGQMVQTEKEKVFVPGQTFETTNGIKYLPGITVNLDNTPTFIAGVIMADDTNSAVFLPGQSIITSDGTMRFTKEGERVTPVGMKKLQMTEDEQWERVEKRKLAREKLEKEKMEKQKAEAKERKRAKKERLDRKKAERARLEKEKQEKLELEKEKLKQNEVQLDRLQGTQKVLQLQKAGELTQGKQAEKLNIDKNELEINGKLGITQNQSDIKTQQDEEILMCNKNGQILNIEIIKQNEHTLTQGKHINLQEKLELERINKNESVLERLEETDVKLNVQSANKTDTNQEVKCLEQKENALLQEKQTELCEISQEKINQETLQLQKPNGIHQEIKLQEFEEENLKLGKSEAENKLRNMTNAEEHYIKDKLQSEGVQQIKLETAKLNDVNQMLELQKKNGTEKNIELERTLNEQNTLDHIEQTMQGLSELEKVTHEHLESGVISGLVETSHNLQKSNVEVTKINGVGKQSVLELENERGIIQRLEDNDTENETQISEQLNANNISTMDTSEMVCTNNDLADFSVHTELANNTEIVTEQETELTNTYKQEVGETNTEKQGTQQNEQAMATESETLKRFNEEILAGMFLQDHAHLIDLEQVDRDREMMKAKTLKAKQEEERKKNAQVAEDMKEVLDTLEMKKSKLLEKLRNIQNETSTYEDRAVTYIYPAKANALAVELGFDGQIARNIAKILLGITRWANTFSAKFHVHSENIEIISYSSEIDEEFHNCSDSLKSALKGAMVAAVEVFKLRPQDLEGGMRAAGKVLTEATEQNGLIIHEIALTLDHKTNSERNVLFSSTLKDLTKKLVVNKAETLRSIIREEFTEEKLIAKINLVIEEEGDILVRAFTNMTNDNSELIKKVYSNVINTASELICEEKSGEVAHRAIVDAVQEISDNQLNKFLTNESAHAIKHFLLEAHTLAEIVGMKNEARTIDRLLKEEDVVSVHVLAADQITLDILRRVLIMRQLADRNPQLRNGLAVLRREPRQAREDRNVRELVRESAALISHACPILSSMDIPSFLFELGNNLAMEDFLVQRIKKDGALLISKKGIQAVVPKEASRFVLSGLISYTLIDDKGVTSFKPMHVFNALKLDKQKEKLYHDYSCVGAFDKYAYSVPVRESLDYNYRNYLNTFYNNQCRADVSELSSICVKLTTNALYLSASFYCN